MRGRSLQGLQVLRLLSRSKDTHRWIARILPPKNAGILGVAYSIVRDFSAKRYQAQTREERIHALLVGNVGSSSCSESPGISLQDALKMEGVTQEDVDSTIATLCAAGDFERATASFMRVQALGDEKGDALSALIGDDTAIQVLAAYTKLGRFAEARKLLPLLHRSREHLQPQCVGVLLQAYCAAGRLNMAEDMLSQWLHLALKHTQRLSASAAGGSVGAASDWDTILQQTLEGAPPVTNGRSAAFGPLHDTGPAIQLLAHMKGRRRAVALKAAEGSEGASPAAFASILQLAGPSAWSHFPDLGVWSSVAKMYASRNSHYECLLVLNLCVSGTVNTAMESAREMQAIYDSTVKVMCSSMQFRKAIAVHKQSINTHRLLTSELKHLSYLLRYMSELETVDEKILGLTANAAQAVLAQKGPTAGRGGKSTLSRAVVALLCKHGSADLAAQFVEGSGPARAHQHTSNTAKVIRSLARSGNVEKALAMFSQILKEQATDRQKGVPRRFIAVPVPVDAAYHDLCAALRHDPERLAWFVSSYKKRLS